MFRFEPSRPGHVWVGGSRFGKACEQGYNTCQSPEACQLALAVTHMCHVVRLVTEGRFDRRFNDNPESLATLARRSFRRLRAN